MRVVVVEDRPESAEVYLRRLSDLGFCPELALSSDPDLVDRVEASGCDALVLSLPFAHGSEELLIRELRRRESSIAISVWQETRDPEAAIVFLDAGADDVVSKPLHLGHAAARLRATLRRCSGKLSDEVRLGELVIPLDGRSPSFRGRSVALSRKEATILSCLARRVGRVVARSFLFSNLYGSDEAPADPKIVDVFVCRIRKKLKELVGADCLVTVFGLGYMLSDPFAASPAVASQGPVLVVSEGRAVRSSRRSGS